MLTSLTEKLAAGTELSALDISQACDQLLDESQPLETRAEFLKTLAAKGETPREIAAFVNVLLDRAVRPSISGEGLIDVCGTGGDKMGFFNISTVVMFVAAAAGAKVVKHGNRGITSRSGGADALEALGIRIDLPPDRIPEILDAAGCCFLFAPLYHPAFKAVGPVRKRLGEEGITTVFNLLGPLLNPIRPDFQLAGIYDESRLETYVETLRILGRKRAFAIHGLGESFRLDEVSISGPTLVCALEDGKSHAFTLEVRDYGIFHEDITILKGGGPAENAEAILQILREKEQGARRDIVLANAAMALLAAGVAGNFGEGIEKSREAIDSGEAFRRIEILRSQQ